MTQLPNLRQFLHLLEAEQNEANRLACTCYLEKDACDSPNYDMH